ncbi:GNAT family N-acetyltransferase [Tenacibaculum agarivorans]|uniref:GNAT family N-acetyltransferase n=1 Tax=Tenacibaculum agarivorans TaxID=1908389 RepID=UPI00094BAE90|nr:GNAT family N-acetyltransferase [Tenacibaculum agarivorans]
MNKKFSNPVWSALEETHSEYLINYDDAKFYHPDYCPFGSFNDSKAIETAMESYAELTSDFFIVGQEAPNYPEHILLKGEYRCLQMELLQEDFKTPEYTSTIIKLTKEHEQEVYDLIMLVMPGTYRKKSFDVGDYYGIFNENKLVAVTGERIQGQNFIEVSGVVTHPDFTRRGYAKQLVAYTSDQILKKGKVPILHVLEINKSAIHLYEKLGYKSIDFMYWRHYVKN